MIILDTSVLIASGLAGLPSDQEYGASILSRAELEFGASIAHGDQADQRRRRLVALDQVFAWLPFTESTTRAYGILSRAVHPHAPAQARRVDTYIAAHALELGVPILTANAADLRWVAHLVTVLEWNSWLGPVQTV